MAFPADVQLGRFWSRILQGLRTTATYARRSQRDPEANANWQGSDELIVDVIGAAQSETETDVSSKQAVDNTAPTGGEPNTRKISLKLNEEVKRDITFVDSNSRHIRERVWMDVLENESRDAGEKWEQRLFKSVLEGCPSTNVTRISTGNPTANPANAFAYASATPKSGAGRFASITNSLFKRNVRGQYDAYLSGDSVSELQVDPRFVAEDERGGGRGAATNLSGDLGVRLGSQVFRTNNIPNIAKASTNLTQAGADVKGETSIVYDAGGAVNHGELFLIGDHIYRHVGGDISGSGSVPARTLTLDRGLVAASPDNTTIYRLSNRVAGIFMRPEALIWGQVFTVPQMNMAPGTFMGATDPNTGMSFSLEQSRSVGMNATFWQMKYRWGALLVRPEAVQIVLH